MRKRLRIELGGKLSSNPAVCFAASLSIPSSQRAIKRNITTHPPPQFRAAKRGTSRPRHGTVHASAGVPRSTAALRERVVSLVGAFGREGGRSLAQAGEIEEAIGELLASRTTEGVAPVTADDLDGSVGVDWRQRLEGRWDLRFSTEGPLLRLMTVGAYPFFATGEVYQLVEGEGLLQNVVEFGRDVERKTIPAVMRVGVEYVTSEEERRCDFKFRTTRFQIGKSAQVSIAEANGLKGAETDGWLDVDWRLNFAIGKGFFRVIWLDHALRIDRDTSNGNDWLNIYVYNGPVERCRAVGSGDS